MGMANSARTAAALEETAAAASVNMGTEGITQAWRDADCSTRRPLPRERLGQASLGACMITTPISPFQWYLESTSLGACMITVTLPELHAAVYGKCAAKSTSLGLSVSANRCAGRHGCGGRHRLK
jgi:hypothetical protein